MDGGIHDCDVLQLDRRGPRIVRAEAHASAALRQRAAGVSIDVRRRVERANHLMARNWQQMIRITKLESTWQL
jgi:hypothetical protein